MKQIYTLLVSLILCSSYLTTTAQSTRRAAVKRVLPDRNNSPLTAIVGAFEEEITLLQNQVQGAKRIHVQGIPFITGLLGGRRVVVGLA